MAFGTFWITTTKFESNEAFQMCLKVLLSVPEGMFMVLKQSFAFLKINSIGMIQICMYKKTPKKKIRRQGNVKKNQNQNFVKYLIIVKRETTYLIKLTFALLFFYFLGRF